MDFDIVKVANAILYMLDRGVTHLNDRKLVSLIFLMDYEYNRVHGEKIFGDEYIKESRQPRAAILSELFEIIANQEDLDEEDERLYLISELLEYLDIEIITKKEFVDLLFFKVEESFDSELFEKEEMKILREFTEKYKEDTPRRVANATFAIDKVRESKNLDVIL